MKNDEIKYEKPKEESYTPEGEEIPKFKIYEKIDIAKSLESIIEKNIPNFTTPSNEIEFIENQILLDYIISEKYKNNKSIFDYNIDYNKNPGFEALSIFFKSKNAKVYYDNSISEDFFKHLKKYYRSENNFKKKIRIRLNLNEKVLQDKMKIQSIISKINSKVSKIIDVKYEDLHVTNVRKNCLLFDIYVLQPIRNASNYIYGRINEEKFNNHKEEFKQFLREIVKENNQNIINFINENDENEWNDIVVDIKEKLSSYVTNENIPEKFDSKYDKLKGTFGRYIFFLPIPKREKTVKNGCIYYYPNKNCEGYGLRVPTQINGEKIFDNSEWCIVYSDILKTKYYNNINQFKGGYIEKLNDDNSVTKFRLFWQCKLKISTISSISRDGCFIADDNYIVPYRLIKENLG